MRTLKIVLLSVFGLILLEVACAEIFLRTQSFAAKDKPSWLETALARHARSVSIPGKAKEETNPRALSDTTLAEAKEHWIEHCSSCHGVDGRGNTVLGRNMYPPAPDMNESSTQQKSDGELFYIVSKGVRLTGMPAWEGEDSPESIWDLVGFIRRLPQLTPEELKEMQQPPGEETAEQEPGRKSKGKSSEGSAKRARPKAKPHSHGPGTKPHDHEP